MSTEEQRFRHIVAAALTQLYAQVDAVDSDDVDARMTDGVLQVDFESGGVFVLSQQVPVQELWLSALSRAWHFKWADGAWKERDSGEPLESVLGTIFARKLGREVRFSNPGPA